MKMFRAHDGMKFCVPSGSSVSEALKRIETCKIVTICTRTHNSVWVARLQNEVGPNDLFRAANVLRKMLRRFPRYF